MIVWNYSFIALETVILFLMWRNRFWSRYRLFYIYFATVAAVDLLFSTVYPIFGIDSRSTWSFNLCYLLELVKHILKLAVVISLYRVFLREYPHLRAITDGILYLGLALAGGLFVLSIEPGSSFLYLAAIHFGKWVFLMVATICAGLLLLKRFTARPMERALFLIVLGFFLFSLPQVLSFTLLTHYYHRYQSAWVLAYTLTYGAAVCIWGVAAVTRAAAPEPEAGGGSWALRPAEVLPLLSRIEASAGAVLKRIAPFH